MRKCIVYGLWFMVFNIYGLLLLPIYHIPYTIYQASAEEASSSAAASASLVQKLDSLKAEIASKAAQFRVDVNKKIQNKALVGFAKDKSNSQITLTTKSGDKVVKVNEYTIYESKARKPALDDLDKNDYIAALGDLDDKSILVAKKIVWLTKPTEDSKAFFWGQVQSITGITLAIKNRDGQRQNILISSRTDFGVDNDDAALADVKVTKFIGGVGIKDSKGNIKADFVYIIPTGGVLKSDSKKTSTGSTTISTPSAKNSH